MRKIALTSLISIAVTMCIAFSVLRCKPSLPVKEDYEDIMPCYFAAYIIVANTYTEQKMEVGDALTKCYRYIDYEKCKNADDYDKCVNKLRVSK